MDSEDVNPCDEYQDALKRQGEAKQMVNMKNKQCEEYTYAEIREYFDLDNLKKHTYTHLLNALMQLYKSGKKEDPEFLVTFHKFIQMFPKTTMESLKFKRQHVFEAMCKILLLFNYDNGELGKNKQFYPSLAELTKTPNMAPIEKRTLLQSPVNESSRGGVVDILFQTDREEPTQRCKDDWECDCVNTPNTSTNSSPSRAKLIMIQNKYYDFEKTNNKDEYDIAKIHVESQKLHSIKPELEKQIVLMVNNKEALDNKLTRSRDLVHSVYGVKQLEDWFRRLLHDLGESDNIQDFIQTKLGKPHDRELLFPRFHQQYFTNTTLAYNRHGHRLFIWGAVPRSGKSYMIGDFISESHRRLPGEQENDIVLILGAKTETEGQFIEMFCKYSNFDEYGIIVASSGVKKCQGREINQPKKKNIYIFSQEWFKADKVDSDANFKPSVINKGVFQSLFEKRKIDIYFDEIHKGGTTDKSENILNAFHNANVKIDVFIMVTATFAKPNIKYNATKFIDIAGKSNKVIEWSYEDQQTMKKMENDTMKQIMINGKKRMENDTLVDTAESDELSSVFDSYRQLYGPESYLNIIAKEYEKHPELVMVSPQVSRPSNIVDIRTCFIQNLKCDACKTVQTRPQLRDPTNIFNDVGRVNDLIKYIAGNPNTTVVDPHSVYSYLHTIGAPTNRVRVHSEIWFLPDKGLYATENCHSVCDPIDKEINHDEDDKDKKGIPNIEPLTRGLAFLLMENSYFSENYNVLIVHNTKPKYKKPDTSGNVWKDTEIFYNTSIQTTLDSPSISAKIKEAERAAFKQNKSLIILTGAKLRLGISLPCADIAFNFDDIKSIDNNYQTMFRVLTERYNTPKPYGYYVDFNKDRSISFLYDYNAVYGSGKNKSNAKRTEALQSLLFMFNYNGLGLVRGDTTKELELYNNLIHELKLDEASYQAYMAKTDVFQNILRKSIGDLNIDILTKLKSVISIHKSNPVRPNKITHVVVDGEQIIETRMPNDSQPPIEDEEELGDKQDDEQDDMTALINNFVEIVPSIIALLALFSDEQNFKCDSLSGCIMASIKQIDELVDTICNCSQDNTVVCYLNMVNNRNPHYTKTRTIRLLQIIQEVINDDKNEIVKNVLNNIFMDIKETMVKKTGLITNMDSEDIQKKIQEYLPVRSEEKDKFGEVFTPPVLIDEMLDKIPSEVWKNPALKWLDPANGTGNFPMKVYEKLLKELPDKYSDKYSNLEGKKKHIIQNMLYMVEINPRNVRIAKKIFGEDANICCADFLEEEPKWRKQFGETIQFDVVVGNPPFQDETSGETAQGGHDIYPTFFIRSFKILQPNGYLSFINPAKWRAPDKKGDLKIMWDTFIQNNPIFLKIYGFDDTKKLFNGGAITRIDYYILQKSISYKDTIVNDEENKEHKLNLREWNFLPNYNIDNIKRILTDESNGINVIYSRGSYGNDKPNIRKIKSNTYKYPVKHTHTVKDGDIFYWSNTNQKGHFGEKKVILGKGLYPYPYNDYKGEYGMSNYSFGIPITSKKEGDDIVNAINTDEFGEIIKSTKWSSGFTDHNMFTYFKPDFYKQFIKPGTKSPSTPSQSPSTPSKSPSSSTPKKQKHTRKETPPKNTGGKNRRTKRNWLMSIF